MLNDSRQSEADQPPCMGPGRAFDIACVIEEVAPLRGTPLLHKSLEFRGVTRNRRKEPGVVVGLYADKGAGGTVRGAVLFQGAFVLMRDVNVFSVTVRAPLHRACEDMCVLPPVEDLMSHRFSSGAERRAVSGEADILPPVRMRMTLSAVSGEGDHRHDTLFGEVTVMGITFPN